MKTITMTPDFEMVASICKRYIHVSFKFAKKSFLKTVSSALILIFTSTQIVMSAPDPYAFLDSKESEVAVESVEAEPSKLSEYNSFFDTTTGFLSMDNPLSTVTGGQSTGSGEVEDSEDVLEASSEPSEDFQKIQSYEFERYSVEDALPAIQSDVATAFILDSIDEKSIEHILDLDVEVGLAALHGELILFTTGNEEEIGILPAARELLKDANLITHTHVDLSDHAQSGPSSVDLQNAVKAPEMEYVLTQNGAYAYNREGTHGRVSHKEYLRELLGALQAGMGEASQTQVRAELNEFIYQMDRYNEASEEERELWRASTSDPTPYHLTSGKVVIEAENWHTNTAGTTDSWTEETTLSNPSGGAYLFAGPDNDTASIEIANKANSPHLEYNIYVDAPGDYYIWVLGQGNGIYDDSLHVGVDGNHSASSIRIDGFDAGSTGNFKWSNHLMDNVNGQRAMINIGTAGNHTLDVWMREDGLSFDKIIFTDDPNFNPDTAQASELIESNRYTADSTPPSGNPSIVESGPTNNPQITINVDSITDNVGGSGLKEFYIREVGSASWGLAYTTFQNTAFTVSDISGSKDIELKVCDQQDNCTDATPLSAGSIVYDRDKPTGSISSPDAPTTETQNITLQFTSPNDNHTLPGNLKYKVREITDPAWSALKDLTDNSFTLSSGYNQKTIEVILVDEAGNESDLLLMPIELVEPSTPALHPETFLMDGGRVVIEAESFYANLANGSSDPWTLYSQGSASETDTDGQFNYLQAGTPASDSTTGKVDAVNVVDGNGNVTASELQYKVNVEADVTYYVWVRGQATGIYDDSVHVGILGEAPNENVDPTTAKEISNFATDGTWSWSKTRMGSGPPVATLNFGSTGEHTIRVWMREDGLKFDKIILTDDPNYNPANDPTNGILGPNESAQAGDNSPTNTAPVVSDVSDNATDRDGAVAGNQVYEGDTITLSADVTDANGDALTWQWVQRINGTETNIAPMAPYPVLAYDWTVPTNSVGNTYEFFLRASDGAEVAVNTPVSFTVIATPPAEPVVVNLFQDDFSTNTLSDYIVSDPILWGVGTSASIQHSLAKQALEVRTMDDAGIILERNLGEIVEKGTLHVNFKTIARYPCGGDVRIRLMETDTNYIEIRNTDQITGCGSSASYPPVSITRYINDVAQEPTVQSTGFDFDQNQIYDVFIDFDADQVDVTGFGAVTSLTNMSPFIVNKVQLYVLQQDIDVNEMNFSKIVDAPVQTPVEDRLETVGSATINYKGVNHTIEVTRGSETQVIDQNIKATALASDALALTLEDGVTAYYVNGEPVEFRTATGVRVTDFVLDSVTNNIVDATITHPNGTVEVVREGVMIRRIAGDGSYADFLPNGDLYREWIPEVTVESVTTPAHMQYYEFTREGENITQTKVYTADGKEVLYDEVGILSSITDGIQTLSYSRSAYTLPDSSAGYKITSSGTTVGDGDLVEAHYTSDGVQVFGRLGNGNEMSFVAGKLESVKNSIGETLADYQVTTLPNLSSGLEVTRADSKFQYDETGFLTMVENTVDGTRIHRELVDLNGDGIFDNLDQINLILEDIESGSRILDFEVDPGDGTVTKYIVETKEGVKQYIDNNVLTHYETVDGRVYKVIDETQARLEKWNFRDGTRVIFDDPDTLEVETTVHEILFPNETSILNPIFNAEQQIQEFTEKDADGNLRLFQSVVGANGEERIRLIKYTSVNGDVIDYDKDGKATKYTLVGEGEFDVTYEYSTESPELVEKIVFSQTQTTNVKNPVYQQLLSEQATNPQNVSQADLDAAGEFITVEQVVNKREFTANGSLLDLLVLGVNATIENDVLTKIENRFATILNPNFDELDYTGDVSYSDLATASVDTGSTVIFTQADGTAIHYTAGKITKIVTVNQEYDILEGSTPHEIQIRTIVNNEPITKSVVPYLQETGTLLGTYINTSVSPQADLFTEWDGVEVEQQGAALGDGALRIGQGDSSSSYTPSITVNNASGWELGSSDFTIEMFVKLDELKTTGFLDLTSNTSNKFIGLGYDHATNKIRFELKDDAGNYFLNLKGDWAPSEGEWYHLAVVRSGDDYMIYVDDNRVAFENHPGLYFNHMSNNMGLGYAAKEGGLESWDYMQGSFDEIRISKGIARYTGETKTIPTEPFLEDSYTELLLHFDQKISEDHPLAQDAAKLEEILMPRTLKNLADTRFGIQTILANGEEFDFVERAFDAERGSVIEAKGNFSTAWKVDNANELYSGGFIARNMNIESSPFYAPAQTSRLIDMNGDGFKDRLWVDDSFDFWWVQLNNGDFFDPAIRWEGVDAEITKHWGQTHNSGALRSYAGVQPLVMSDLVDMNGDALPDRVMRTQDGSDKMVVQFNNGAGFDESFEWGGTLEGYSNLSEVVRFALEARNVDRDGLVQELVTMLIDMNGDGRADRVIAPIGGDQVGDPHDTWIWQENNGQGFEPGLTWNNINHSSNSDDVTLGKSLSWSETVANNIQHPAAIAISTGVSSLGGGGADLVISTLRQYGEHTMADFLSGPGTYYYSAQDDERFRDPANVALDSFAKMTLEVSKLIDMDGDGDMDRVYIKPTNSSDPDGAQTWYWQRNLTIDANSEENKFADEAVWDTTVRSIPHAPTVRAGSAISLQETQFGARNMQSMLIDMNGDNKPDRVTVEANGDHKRQHSSWWVEINNGNGFNDPPQQWTGIEGFNREETSITQNTESFMAVEHGQVSGPDTRKISSLVDMNGDNIVDRVVFQKSKNQWLVQYGTGSGFSEGQLLDIYGVEVPVEDVNTPKYESLHISLKANEQITPAHGTFTVSLYDEAGGLIKAWNQTDFGNLTSAWQDYYLDLDQSIETRGKEIRIKYESLGVPPAEEVHAFDLQRTLGLHRHSTGDQTTNWSAGAGGPALNEKWVLANASEDFDFTEAIAKGYRDPNFDSAWYYITPDGSVYAWTNAAGHAGTPASISADSRFIANIGAHHYQNLDDWLALQDVRNPNETEKTIYMDNLSFVAERPDASQDWLNRMLTNEGTITTIQDQATQKLQDFLGLSEASDATGFNWETLLSAHTVMHFEAPAVGEAFGELHMIETFNGSSSTVVDGKVSRTTLADNTVIDYSYSETDPNSVTQTVKTDAECEDGSAGCTRTETIELDYGRIRNLTGVLSGDTDNSEDTAIQYRYEFDPLGREITVVTDSVKNITERYLDGLVIRRTSSAGVDTYFTYDEEDKLIQSQVFYKGRVQSTFHHGTTDEGNTTLTSEDGLVEVYDENGDVLYHITEEGFRYEHSRGNAKVAQVKSSSETDKSVNLLEGLADDAGVWAGLESGTINYVVPGFDMVNCTEGVNCVEVHEVRLAGYEASNGDLVDYDKDVLRGITLADGMQIIFQNYEVIDELDPETAERTREIKLTEAAVFHTDGTVTEFKGAEPFLVKSASGVELNLDKDDTGEFFDHNESTEFHHDIATTLWNDVVTKAWQDYQLPGSLVVNSEYDDSGNLVTLEYAEGTTELHSEGHIDMMLGADGEVLVEYEYDDVETQTQAMKDLDSDDDHDLVNIQMSGTRQGLELSILELRANVVMERIDAEITVRGREQVGQLIIDSEYIVIRDRLLEVRDQLLEQQDYLASLSIPGKAGREIIAGAQRQIQDGLTQVYNGLQDAADQREEALVDLEASIQEAFDDIATESANAITEIETREAELQEDIVKQEITPVVSHWYRKILGRDPSKAEVDSYAATTLYDDKSFNVSSIIDNPAISTELSVREGEVQLIQDGVNASLQAYLDASDKAGVLLSYGITSAYTDEHPIVFTQDDKNAFATWMTEQSLHFGQSAFLALESLFEADPTVTTPDRIQMASDMIVIDVLTGVLSHLERNDLILSMFAMRLAAQKHGLTLSSYQMSQDALYAMFLEECPGIATPVGPATDNEGNPTSYQQTSAACDFSVVVHVDGNHYITVTGFEIRVKTEMVQAVDGQGNPLFEEDGTMPVMIEQIVLDDDGTPILEEFVKYVDPGKGAIGEQIVEEMTLESFINVWRDVRNPEAGIGYVITPRAPPASHEVDGETIFFSEEEVRVLSVEEEQAVRGAFFGLIALAIAFIVNVIVAAVSAVIAFVTAILSALLGAIGSILSGIGNFISLLAQGQFLQGFGALFKGVFIGLKEIAVGVFQGFVSAGQAFNGVFAGQGGFFSAVKGLYDGVAAVKIGWFGIGKYVADSIAIAVVGYAIDGIGSLLEVLGVSPKIARTVSATGKFVTGVALAANGNPVGIGTSMGLITGGTNEFLNLHTDLPNTSYGSLITAGISAIGFAVGAGFSEKGLVEGLKAAAPMLSSDFAAAGLTAVGSALDLNPMITSALSIPLRAAVGGVTGNSLGLENYNNVVSKIAGDTLAGAVSFGASVGLDALGAPQILQSFVPGILGQLVQEASGLTGGGGGPGDVTAKERGESLFSKIGEGIAKFSKGIANAAGTVVSFGAKVIEGVGSVTKAGFAKAVDFFSGVFDRETVEKITNNGADTVEAALLGGCGNAVGGVINCTVNSVSLSFDENTNSLQVSGDSFEDEFLDLSLTGGELSGDITRNREEQGLNIQEKYSNGSSLGISISDVDLNQLLEISPIDEHTPLKFGNDGTVINGNIYGFDASYSFMDGKYIAINYSGDSQFLVENVALDIDTYIQTSQADGRLFVETGIFNLSQEAKDAFVSAGMSLASLGGYLMGQLGQDDFDTNAHLLQLKSDIKNGYISYENFTSDPTKLGVIHSSQLDLDHTGLFSDGWVTEVDYPIEVQQSKLMQAATLEGMAMAGVGAISIDPGYDNVDPFGSYDVPTLANGDKVVSSTAAFKISADAVSSILQHGYALSQANKVFQDQDISKYTVIKQTKGTEERVFIVVEEISADRQYYRVVNTGYAENVLMEV